MYWLLKNKKKQKTKNLEKIFRLFHLKIKCNGEIKAFHSSAFGSFNSKHSRPAPYVYCILPNVWDLKKIFLSETTEK
jgi:hypothetical protein